MWEGSNLIAMRDAYSSGEGVCRLSRWRGGGEPFLSLFCPLADTEFPSTPFLTKHVPPPTS